MNRAVLNPGEEIGTACGKNALMIKGESSQSAGDLFYKAFAIHS